MFKNIGICLHKDFMFYLQSGIIYIVMPVYLVLAAGFTFYISDFMVNTTANAYPFFSYQPSVMALILPALTMRLWADEYKQNTLEILLTQPVSPAAVVAGKFLAVWSVAGILLAASVPIWLISAWFVPLSLGQIAVNYLMTFLICGALAAVSATAAAFCYNALNAFLVSVVVCVGIAAVDISFLAEYLLPENRLVLQLSQAFDFSGQFDLAISGQISPATAGYFVVLGAAALILNVAAVEYKRSGF